MRQHVVLSLFFLRLATLVLFLGPSYLLAVIKLVQIIRELANNKQMPQKIDNYPLDWDKIPTNECKHVPFNFPWFITSKDETLTVMINCLKWTFIYDFCIRVTVENFKTDRCFSSLLRDPAAKRYGSTNEAATPWKDSRTNFMTQFSDGRNKFRHRLEVEHCVRRDGEEIRNFLHRIEKTVDKGWPDDMNRIAGGQQNAEWDAQARRGRDDTWTTAWEDSDLDICNVKPKNN